MSMRSAGATGRELSTLRTRADEFHRFLSPKGRRVAPSRSSSLDRLIKVSETQLAELASDVGDELARRKRAQAGHRAALELERDSRYDDKHNEARAKLSKLTDAKMRDLVHDLYTMIASRHPELASGGKTRRNSGSDSSTSDSDSESSEDSYAEHRKHSRRKKESRRSPSDQISMGATMVKAEELARDSFRKKDPSRDILHVDRVRRTALSLARALREEGHRIDLRVVELAALLHDVAADAKAGVSAHSILKPFFEKHARVRREQADLVIRIVDAVGAKRETSKHDKDSSHHAWAKHCYELHCVGDADALDAIGAIGILRLAATAGLSGRALFDPVEDDEDDGANNMDMSQPGTAVAQISEKLYRVKDIVVLPRAKEIAERRHKVLQRFVWELHKENEEVGSS